MNLDYIVEWDMHVCLLEGHELASPPKVKYHLSLCLIVLLSLMLINQLELVYPSNAVRKLLEDNINSIVLFRYPFYTIGNVT